MRLLLTSNGLCNDAIRNTLQNMLDKPVSECNFVFIFTAANGSWSDKSWLARDLYNAQSMGWGNFQMLDLAIVGNWDKALWWQTLEKADVILVGGGKGGYLSYWMQQSGVFEALPELLKTKVYVGISAGSMFATAGLGVSWDAMANKAELYEFPLDLPGTPAGQTSRKTLQLVDVMFRPHWQRKDQGGVDEAALRKAYRHIQKSIYAGDDQTALKVIDNHIEVVTEGKWLLINEA